MLQISEAFLSGEGELGANSSEEYSAHVWGDPNQATDDANNPMKIVGFAIPRFGIVTELGNIFHDFSYEKKGPGRWLVTAKYKAPEFRQTNDASFSFKVGGATRKITQSLQTIAVYAATNFPDPVSGAPTSVRAPNFNGAINVSDRGVEGVDIDVKNFEFTTTFYIDPSNMTESYVQELKGASPSVNSDTVTLNVDGVQMSFPPGSLKLRDGSGSKRKGFGDWELSLNWAYSPNITGLTIGGGSDGVISGISCNGWDYLWCYYQDTVDSDANMKVACPMAAYVERVYDYQPLSGILPPTAFGVGNSQSWLTPSPLTGGAGFSG